VLGSEAEIGSSDFHAGEIACGFIEQLPKKIQLIIAIGPILLERRNGIKINRRGTNPRIRKPGV